MIARIQADAASELPADVVPELRPISNGARRLIEGWRPVRDVALVHGLDVDLPVRSAAPSVATVHDLSVFDVPWAFSRYRARGERFAVGRGIRSADALIAVSRFTAEAVEARFGRTATVIHLAPAPGFRLASETDRARVIERYQLPDRFVLHVGTVEPRKDVAGLAEACRRIGVPLVLAGAVVADLPNETGVRFLGYVPAVDLGPLYASATAVGYPSRYEGFGLPPIEAMACGAAVVASAVGALPDIVGTTMPLVRPGDLDELTDALSSAVNDAEQQRLLRTAGEKAVATLDWSKTAAATIDVYRGLGLTT